MAKTFSLKTIRVTITLGKGVFSEGGNVKVIEGLACEVSVEKPGLPDKNKARVKVWGLKLEDMAQLTMLSFRPLESQHNLLEIQAGEQGAALPLVFRGEILSAFADFNSAPDVCMEFTADSGTYAQQIAASPASAQGEVNADGLFALFAAEAGYTYKNEGVSASVRNPWLAGSPVDKLVKLARDIGCELLIDDGSVLVMPAGRARSGGTVLLSKETGLIGYPTFNQDGISCRCIFNPGLQHGGLVQVKSIVPRSSGLWRVNKLTHNLGAYQPSGGSWETQLEAVYHGE